MTKKTAWITWIIGIVLAIIFGIFPYLLRNTSRKNLSYQIISYDATNYKTAETTNRLRLFYDSKEIENLQSLLIEFVNNGNEPIKSNDFESDLEIKFCTDTKILRFDIVKTIPENIIVQHVICDSIIKIKPTLLNPNDRIMAMAILTGKPIVPQIYGRIVGVEKIEENDTEQLEYRDTLIKIWSDGIIGFLLLILSYYVFSLFLIMNKLHHLFWICCSACILYFGGRMLVSYWYENINFMLPEWITLILHCIFFVSFSCLFYKINKKMKITYGP